MGGLGIVSHNPPGDGGFKYNLPTGGPADSDTTKIIQDRANEILKGELKEVIRIPFDRAIKNANVHSYDYIKPYVNDLSNIVDTELISSSGLRLGVDPMGGAGIDFWDYITEKHRINIEKQLLVFEENSS